MLWFPSYENVVRSLSFKDQLQVLLQSARGIKTIGRPIEIACCIILLPLDPVAEVRVGERF